MTHKQNLRIIRPNAGFILLPRRFVDVGMPKAGVSAKGRYQLIVRDAWGIEKRRTPWFDNLILDSGLNRWGTGQIIAGAAIGTGTSTPAATDTGLQTQTHYTTVSGTGHNAITVGSSPNYNNTATFVYRTTLGALNGNYTEVGVGWASGSAMFSRALILDGGGSPTAISVLSAEQLDIVYELSVYPPLVDTGPAIVTISGVDYDVTGRAAYVTATGAFGVGWSIPAAAAFTLASGDQTSRVSNGAIGAITASIGGSTDYMGAASTDAYSASSLTRTATATASLLRGNVAGGISATTAFWGTFAQFQYGFSPSIPKDGTKTLALNYSVSWARRP